MENSSIDGPIEPVNTESKIPMILAIAAFVLGGLSFVFAWNTKSNLTRHKDNIIKDVNEAVEVAKQAAADARNADSGSDGLADLRAEFEAFKMSVNAGYQKIGDSQAVIVKNQKELNNRLLELEGKRPATPANAQPVKPANGGTTATPAPASNGKYKVKKGDYPAKIAKELGVSTNALMEANPGLDPKKLQIGQELNVPAKK